MAEITKEYLRTLDGAAFRAALAGPERAKVEEVIKSLNLEQALDLQEQMQRNNAANLGTETPVVDEAAKAAEEARLAEEARVKAEADAAAKKAADEASKTPKKFSVDYQIKDEDGNPIGRPTHLEAASEEELRSKIIEAHTQATRAFHRLKRQKVSFKDQQPAAAPATDAELLKAMDDLKSDKPETVVAAHRRIAEIEQKRVREQQADEAKELQRQQDVSMKFLKVHEKDFNNCQANVDQIAEYFKENQLQWTYDNLEIAFHALEDKLAPVVEPAAPAPAANPQVQNPPTTTTAAAPTPQPTPPATEVPAAQPNPQPAARPGVNGGGMMPGQSSATRPVQNAEPAIDWAAEIRSWDGPTSRRKLADPKIKAAVTKFLADRAAKRSA